MPLPPSLARRGRSLGGIAAAALLAGTTLPAQAGPGDRPAGLAGTSWQLVEIRSMDDAQGIVRPRDPSLYTLRLQPGGRAALRLDCNRASGTWTVKPGRDRGNGSFRFGPLAATSALCPPPSLGERLGRQLSYVRGYLLREGRLHLSLMADGGILVWEPLAEGGVAYSGSPDPALERAILRASPDYARSLQGAGGRRRYARYVHARTDLDGDGREEVVAYLMGPYFCGTGGCNLQIYRRSGRGYRLVSDFPTSDLPLIVARQRSRGWHDLWRLQRGGGAPASYQRQVFDGRRYAGQERIPADRGTPGGTPVLTGAPKYGDGALLRPRP